jgi:PPOX class probable F420-dependent enzyme
MGQDAGMATDPIRRRRIAASLGASPYVNVTTYRKDGTPVTTPMQVVARGEFLFVWTRPDAGKVKRLRRDPVLRIAPCTLRGRPTGPSFTGIGRIVGGGADEMVRDLMLAKYGWRVRWWLRWQKVRRRGPDRVSIQITLEPDLEDDSPALRDD